MQVHDGMLHQSSVLKRSVESVSFMKLLVFFGLVLRRFLELLKLASFFPSETRTFLHFKFTRSFPSYLLQQVVKLQEQKKTV